MAAYYNEIDPYAAEWLRNLIKAGHIADGEVDTRSIVDVKPNELRSFTQCHFFAGIAGWSHALRLAGWADDRKIWTGSCPCQPFSVAGKGAGVNDERHLWPHFFRLIREVRPPVVMGEQVAGAAGYGWLDGVRSDLESENYSCEGVDIPACAVNAPHIRQRLYWVAMDNAKSAGLEGRFNNTSEQTVETRDGNIGTASGNPFNMADADKPISSEERQQRSGKQLRVGENEGNSNDINMAKPNSHGHDGTRRDAPIQSRKLCWLPDDLLERAK
jgi:DNA (cytosine-5)-methyltransferase 1